MMIDDALLAVTSFRRDRSSASERSISRGEIVSLLDELLALGEGYLEVRRLDDEYPVLLVGFCKESFVIQAMTDSDSMTLLQGDDSVAASERVEVLVMNESATFTGDYVMEYSRARAIFLRFVDGAPLDSIGEWRAL